LAKLVILLLCVSCSSTSPSIQKSDSIIKPATKKIVAIIPAPPENTPTANESAEGAEVPASTISLIGQSMKEVTALLGSPEFIRRDIGLELWQYRGKHCVLDLAFYEIDSSPQLEVRHIEARTKQGKPVASELCMAQSSKKSGPLTN
jgi:hypothetical protein